MNPSINGTMDSSETGMNPAALERWTAVREEWIL